jgi:glycosyltransferase involved in cell wall biosynthesis
MSNKNSKYLEVSIVMPCLNEAETIKKCIEKAFYFLDKNKINGEVLIGDNGSTDDSRQIAISCGAQVVEIAEKGYGRALMGVFIQARGKYIIMGDSDDSYDFSELTPFLEKLREGYDLVIGNRFKGKIMPNAMPIMNKYVGNPVLSTIGRFFFRSEIGDFHCGLRGFKRESLMALGLKTTGMEFASEMIVVATLKKLKITEVPVILSPDGRNRPSHLRPWQDGWRHLNFLLANSQGPIFLVRELMLMAGGLIRKMYRF